MGIDRSGRAGWVKGVLALAVAAGAGVGSAARAGESPGPAALLRRSAASLSELAVSGRQQVTLWHETGADVLVTQERRSGGRVRSEVVLPRARRGELSVDDGGARWSYDPRSRRLVHGTAPAAVSPATEVGLVEANYRMDVAPAPESAAGRRAWVVTLRPLDAGKPMRRLWIDAATAFPLKVEQFHADGEHQSVTEFQNITFPASLPASLFARPPASRVREERDAGTEAPVGMEAIRRALGVTPPRELPLGYHFQDAAAIGEGREAVYHLRYGDGLSVVSLFLSRSGARFPGGDSARKVALGAGHAALHEDPHVRILRWEAGGLHGALVGDLAPEALGRIASASGLAGGATARARRSPLADPWLLVPAAVALMGAVFWSTLFFVRRQRAPL